MSLEQSHGQMALINAAARMAAAWWGRRLYSEHASKRQAFVDALRDLTRRTLLGEIDWEWGEGEPVPGNGKVRLRMSLESDYDPQGALLKAVRDAVAPDCRGMLFSSDGILPRKHAVTIDLRSRVLKPKEGYGNWTDPISILVTDEDRA